MTREYKKGYFGQMTQLDSKNVLKAPVVLDSRTVYTTDLIFL
jgi:hypothetical protein